MTIQRSSLLVSVVLVFAVGCATSGPAPKLVHLHQEGTDLAVYQSVEVEVAATKRAYLTENDIFRIQGRILRAIEINHRDRFSSLNSPSESPYLRARVEIKRYDEGSAFARWMLAGLGQIHIDADVFLYAQDSQEVLAQYAVAKTFAWGGAYGGLTTIRNVELGFADSVAKAITK